MNKAVSSRLLRQRKPFPRHSIRGGTFCCLGLGSLLPSHALLHPRAPSGTGAEMFNSTTHSVADSQTLFLWTYPALIRLAHYKITYLYQNMLVLNFSPGLLCPSGKDKGQLLPAGPQAQLVLLGAHWSPAAWPQYTQTTSSCLLHCQPRLSTKTFHELLNTSVI